MIENGEKLAKHGSFTLTKLPSNFRLTFGIQIHLKLLINLNWKKIYFWKTGRITKEEETSRIAKILQLLAHNIKIGGVSNSYQREHFFEEKAAQILQPPMQTHFSVFCIKITFSLIFIKEGKLQKSNNVLVYIRVC